MNPTYLIACSIVWRKTGDEEAGREMVLALGDRDPDVRFLAERLIVAAGPMSLQLLECAVSSGEVDAKQGTRCILEVLDRYAVFGPRPECTEAELMRVN